MAILACLCISLYACVCHPFFIFYLLGPCRKRSCLPHAWCPPCSCGRPPHCCPGQLPSGIPGVYPDPPPKKKRLATKRSQKPIQFCCLKKKKRLRFTIKSKATNSLCGSCPVTFSPQAGYGPFCLSGAACWPKPGHPDASRPWSATVAISFISFICTCFAKAQPNLPPPDTPCPLASPTRTPDIKKTKKTRCCFPVRSPIVLFHHCRIFTIIRNAELPCNLYLLHTNLCITGLKSKNAVMAVPGNSLPGVA